MGFEIGSLKLPQPFMLAPLAGISTLPLRMISRKFGCPFAFVEMIDAGSLTHAARKTFELLKSVPGDRPLGVQLLGADPDMISRALEKLHSFEFDLLDFNIACPKKKVTGKGKGAALLKHPARFKKILKILVREAKVPVTAKIRIGWAEGEDAVKIAATAEDAGINALVVHGRTAKQGYSGRVDYPAIARIKKKLKIPLIASGDIFDVPLAAKMFTETGCDAVMVARGALGNPWIFSALGEFLRTGTSMPPLDRKQVAEVIKEHYDLCADCFGEERGTLKFRKFFIWYTHGFAGVKRLRRKIERVSDRRELYALIEEFLSDSCN